MDMRLSSFVSPLHHKESISRMHEALHRFRELEKNKNFLEISQDNDMTSHDSISNDDRNVVSLQRAEPDSQNSLYELSREPNTRLKRKATKKSGYNVIVHRFNAYQQQQINETTQKIPVFPFLNELDLDNWKRLPLKEKNSFRYDLAKLSHLI